MSPSSESDYVGGRQMAGIPKLKGKATYARWCFAMTSYLRKAKTWDVVSGTTPRPESAPDAPSDDDDDPPFDDALSSHAPVTAWEERNNSARYDIIATLSEEQLNKVVELGYDATAKQVWDFLARENAPTGDVGKQVLLGQLYNSRYIDGTDMDAHLVRMRQLASQLAAVGEPISDATFGVLVKGSLPSPSWDTVIFLLDGETLDRETLCTRLVTHAERRKVQQQQNSSSSSRNAAALSAQDPSQDQCYNCKGVGHHANACPKPATAETLAARKRAKNRSSRDRSSAKKATPTTTNSSNSSKESTFVLNAQVRKQSWNALVHSTIEKWIVDSGAGRHLTGCREALFNYVEEPLSIDVADNRTVISPGRGSLMLKTGDGLTIVLRTVHYLPGAGAGLLSVGALGDDADVFFHGGKGTATVKVNGKVMFRTLPNTPYVLDATIVIPESSNTAPPESSTALATRESKAAPLMLWHRRLGHIAPSTILQLDKKKAVDGLLLSDSKVEDCESCILAKSKKAPFSAISTPVKRPLARVFIDLGFPKVADSKGRDLYLVIADQHSAARWTFPLASKDAETVLAVFKDWHVAAEKVSGQTLARVRSDNGSEFVNATFRSYFKEHGITHETTAPYTPEQNGQAERMNGTLMAATKALLHESGFDKSDWPLALAVATYTGNRTAHPRLDGVTPYEVFTGKKPYVGHLRPFGSIAFTHVDRSLRAKLDNAAVKGRLVGYSGDYNYEIRLDSGKIITTRHATFGRLESQSLDDNFVVPPSSLEPAAIQPSPAQPVPSSSSRRFVVSRTSRRRLRRRSTNTASSKPVRTPASSKTSTLPTSSKDVELEGTSFSTGKSRSLLVSLSSPTTSPLRRTTFGRRFPSLSESRCRTSRGRTRRRWIRLTALSGSELCRLSGMLSSPTKSCRRRSFLSAPKLSGRLGCSRSRPTSTGLAASRLVWSRKVLLSAPGSTSTRRSPRLRARRRSATSSPSPQRRTSPSLTSTLTLPF